MTEVNDLPNAPVFPPVDPASTGTQCAAGSQRYPDESLTGPCHACGHFACRLGPKGPVPCEVCGVMVRLRAFAGDNTEAATTALRRLAELQQRFDALEQRVIRATAFPI
jgi:hypothetical protein